MATAHKLSPAALATRIMVDTMGLEADVTDDRDYDVTTNTAEIHSMIMLGIAAYNDKSNQLEPAADLEYPILNDDGTQLDDKGALFATVAKLSSVMSAQLVRDGQRELDAPLSAAASHGRMIGHALIARDLILAFIARNTQEGAL